MRIPLISDSTRVLAVDLNRAQRQKYSGRVPLSTWVEARASRSKAHWDGFGDMLDPQYDPHMSKKICWPLPVAVLPILSRGKIYDAHPGSRPRQPAKDSSSSPRRSDGFIPVRKPAWSTPADSSGCLARNRVLATLWSNFLSLAGFTLTSPVIVDEQVD